MNVLLVADDEASARRLRAIGRVLSGAGHRVSVFEAPSAWNARRETGQSAVEPRWTADAVVASPWRLPATAFLRRHVLVVDGSSVPPVERRVAVWDDAPAATRRRACGRRAALAAVRADAVLVAGDAQRRWWRDRLVGRDPPLLELPSGIPDDDPEGDDVDVPGVPPSWSIVLWWAGASPGLDLDTLLQARALLGGATVSVVVPTAGRPHGSPSAEELLERAAVHGVKPPQVVAFQGPVPDDERHRLLRRATVLALLHHPVREAELAFHTPAVDGLWARVPVLLTEGGMVSDLARAHGWGAVVPPRDPRAAAAAMELLLRGRTRARCREALARDREHWRWSRVARPLVELLPDLPTVPRPGLVGTALRVAVDRWGPGGSSP